MKTALLSRRPARCRPACRQRGVVMLFGLIALAIMLIGAAAMVSSMNTSMLNAGNLGFKRDMTNQADRAVAAAVDRLVTGALIAEATREGSLPTQNYSATILPTTAQGLPTNLVDSSTFGTVGTAANDITLTSQGVTMRYVIDRLCANTGPATSDHCSMAPDASPRSGPASGLGSPQPAPKDQVLYRVSIQVTGPRNTQAFYQATLTL